MTIALLSALLLSHHETTAPASDPRITKIGRFDSPVAGSERCSWSGSTIAFTTTAHTLTLNVSSKGANSLEVLIDGVPDLPFRLAEGGNQTKRHLPQGRHEIRLIKRTEPFVGTVTFESVSGDGQFGPAPRKPRTIQFVGDSITCGFGNEGKKETEPFEPGTENAAMTYGMITARNLNAEADIIAWSGRKMWPDNTTPSIYDLVNPALPDSPKVDFAKMPKPDVVVIHLATNDFGKENPDENGWCAAYEAFIKRLQGLYPKANIYCAIGSMMSDSWPPNHKALTTVRRYVQRIVKDMNSPKVSWIEFDQQKMEDGIGSSWHPNIKTHTKMADRLTARLKKDLGW